MTAEYSIYDDPELSEYKEDIEDRPITVWHLISWFCSCAIGWGLVWLIVFGISRAIDMHK